VHHLHNTAFAALFPVADIFGVVEGRANATFRVIEVVLLGCGIYVLLSMLTWVLIRALEAVLAPPAARPHGERGVVRWA
jgi:ABC-type arginine/histidine transport system permease subunit